MIVSLVFISVVAVTADPQPKLTLDAALKEALSTSAAMKSGKHGVDAAVERQNSAGRLLQDNPTVELRGGPEVPNFLDGQASVRVGQKWEGPWLRSARMRRASKEREQAQAEESVLRLNTERELRAAYAVAAWADALLVTTQEALKDAQQRAEVIRQQVSGGQAAPMDQQMAEADEALQRAEVRQVEMLRKGARATLATLMNRDSPITEELEPLPTQRTSVRGFSVNGHPEVQALLKEADVAQAEASELRMEAIPTLGTTLTYQLSRKDFPRTTMPLAPPRDAALNGEYEHQVLASVEIPIPIFNINGSEAAEQRALARQHREEAEEMRELVKVERIDAEARANAAAAGIVELKRAVELAEQALSSAQAARQAGQFSLVDELQARDRALKARFDLINAQRELADAEAVIAAMDTFTAN